ncbi:hypothetical protein I203_106606 [Kwoniella mangroviensis CBS 8507]|uniref:uncharacterized protein n=1 Tax=Kwoniella mangroviensis CBS 8507 TaxID=1296122 RepID=UPI00080CC9F2|nr:uncharacterized protein I203_06897 [Kwoniella mangroviensis CBS 8507]OCF63941.1 hypothetical protein I203_06897 [Kwoniella mangroviensis CBS 8507]
MSSLWISDSSPLFFYSPAEAYFAGQNLNSWIGNQGPYQGPGSSELNVNGESSTFHSSFGESAVVLPSIYATSFTPVFSAPSTYNVTIQIGSWDPEPWSSGRSFNFTNGEFDPQTFTLTFDCQSQNQEECGEVDFLGAWVETRFSPDGSQIDSISMDDSSPLITYEGFAPIDRNNKIVNIDPTVDYQQTLSMTSTQGAKATINFTGASIFLYGVTCPSCGIFTITLDSSSTSATLDSFNNATIHDSLLLFTTNLNTASTHTLVLEAQGGVVLDKFEVRGPKGGVGFIGNENGTPTTLNPSSSSHPASGNTSSNSNNTGSSSNNGNIPSSQGGTLNAGVIVGAILGSIAGLAFLYFLCRKVSPKFKKKDTKKLNPWDEANLLQNMKNEEVHVTTAANQRYVYPGLIAHSDLKK